MKRVGIAIVIVFVALAGFIGWQVVKPSDEPVYKGRRLTQWLEDYDDPKSLQPHFDVNARQDEAGGAIRRIGTDAIPTLLRLCRAKDPPFKAKVLGLLARKHLIKVQSKLAADWIRLAYTGFYLLGTNAQSAVPELIRIVGENISPDSRRCAILSLAAIGPPAKQAVPNLLQWSADRETAVRTFAQQALLRIDLEAAIEAGLTNVVWIDFPP